MFGSKPRGISYEDALSNQLWARGKTLYSHSKNGSISKSSWCCNILIIATSFLLILSFKWSKDPMIPFAYSLLYPKLQRVWFDRKVALTLDVLQRTFEKDCHPTAVIDGLSFMSNTCNVWLFVKALAKAAATSLALRFSVNDSHPSQASKPSSLISLFEM